MAAFDVLAAVREHDAYANLVLSEVLRKRRLSGRDAAFATELASGTLRRRGTYEAVLTACLDRPLAAVQPAVLDVLVLGVHQLLAMRVPSHAGVGTSVDLVRARVGRGAAGFVNAVLRQVSSHDEATWLDRVVPADAAPVERLSVRHSHPRWVVECLAEALSSDQSSDAGCAELEELLAADNVAPQVTLVARPGLCDVAELVAAGGEATGRSPFAVRLPGGDPGQVVAVREGRAGVQDEGSQLVALAAACARMEGRDERWLDLCAGPGGKSALLASIASSRGARVVAADVAHHRSRLVCAATRAAGDGLLGVLTADGTSPVWRPGGVDRVLVDAPCSGLGALRRRPEARWRRTSGDVPALARLQRGLLTASLEAVRPGGVVVYATCSPVVAETADVVRAVLERAPDVALEDAADVLALATGGGGLDESASRTLPGSVQLWPHRHGTDAMFLAVLRRRS